MKKIYLLSLLLFCSQFMNAQGLTWSNDCSTGKPSISSTIVYRFNIISDVLISMALANGTSGQRILFFPDHNYEVIDNVNIPSNVILKGNSSAVFTIKRNNIAVKMSGVTNSGIEGITFFNESRIPECDPLGSQDNFSIKIENASNCWVKGVKSFFGGAKGHISLNNSNNNEISGCDISMNRGAGDVAGGRAYGIYLNNSSNNVISRNTLSTLRHHILLEGTSKFNLIKENNILNTNAYNYGIFCPWVSTGLATFGQIEFHGGGSGQNTVILNCLDGCINYYFESSRGKTNNEGGDIIISNNTQSVHFSDNPIVMPLSFNNNTSVSTPACSLSPTASITCPFQFTIPDEPPVLFVETISCRKYYRQSSGAFVSQTPGTIIVDIPLLGTLPFTINVFGGSSPAVTLNNVNIRNFDIPNILEGAYTVKITDANGRVMTATALVNCTTHYISGGGRYEELRVNTTTTNNNNLANAIVDKNKVGSTELEKINETLRLQLEKSGNAPLGLISYPNPATDQMNIRYEIEENDIVSIQLINNLGQVVKVIENQVSRTPGIYEVTFSRDNLANGVYHGVLISKNHKYNFKIILK